MDKPNTYVEGFHNLEDVKKMKYNAFGNTDLKVSELSLGTGGFCNFYGAFSLDNCKDTVLEALKCGINYIDTAPWYGHGTSEEILGKCLEGIPRKCYYLATKVGRYEKEPKLMFDFSAEKTRQSLDRSLKRLGVDYVDVIQVHDIEFAPSLDMVIKETLPVLEEAVKAGKARYIGVTGYPISVLKECIKASNVKIDMMLSYTRLTLIDNSLQEFLPFFKEKNLGIVSASALSMGLLTNGGPQPWHPAHPEIKDVCSEARDYCKSKNVELAKLAMHFAFKQPGPQTNLVGVNQVKLLKSNLEVLRNGLGEVEAEVMRHLVKNVFSKLKQKHWEGVELERFKTGDIFK